MSKSVLSVLLLLLSCAVLFLIVQDTAGQPPLSQLYVDDDAWDALMEGREAFDGAVSVRFNEYELFRDHETGLLLYSLIEDHPKAYDPLVQADLHQQRARVAVRGEELTEDLIAENQAIDLMVYTDDAYAVFELKGTTLPVIEIQIAAEDVELEYKDTHLKLFDNRKEAVNRMIESDTGIHYRGRNSAKYPKQPYRLSLFTESVGNSRRKNSLSLLGLRMDEDWILNAAYNDREKIREVFSTNLWYESCSQNNEWGIPLGMHYKHVELFMNGDYRGMYGLGHPIDAKQVDLQSDEYFYKKINPTAREDEINFYAPDIGTHYEYLGSDLNHPTWEPLAHYYQVLFNAANLDRETLYSVVDLNNSIDIYLFLNLIQGIDHAHLRGANVIYNLFLTCKKTADGQYKVLYTPWDMDRTWGLDFQNIYTLNPTIDVVMDTNVANILLKANDEEMLELVTERYNELRNGAWSDEHLEEMIWELEERMFYSGAFARDFEKWYPEEDVEEAVFLGLTDFAIYVSERMHYMDAYVEELSYDW